MSCEVHILAWNEAAILPYTLRHYRTFCDKMVVHDARSTDRTRDIAQWWGAEVRDWNLGDSVDEQKYVELRNGCWRGTDAHWVIVADADEFLWFPEGAGSTLARYEAKGAAVIKPHGFEMFTETYPTTTDQIYDEVKLGAPDDKWYAKPVLFSPIKIADSGLGMGSHESDPVLHDGRKIHVGANWPFAKPPCYLLHFHQIGPIARIAAKYDENLKRRSRYNYEHNMGNFKPGMEHALEKRNYILKSLQNVVP